jgi:hypothetical protein
MLFAVALPLFAVISASQPRPVSPGSITGYIFVCIHVASSSEGSVRSKDCLVFSEPVVDCLCETRRLPLGVDDSEKDGLEDENSHNDE